MLIQNLAAKFYLDPNTKLEPVNQTIVSVNVALPYQMGYLEVTQRVVV